MIHVLDPGFLLGLLAIAVPIVLHLLLRRRVPVVLFPLVRLLERAERTRQPRRKLNRVLLLAARTLMLALLALALARLELGSSGVVSASGPEAVVVILDDSLSMAARDEDGRSAFELGKEAADRLLRDLPDGSSSAVLAASAPERTESGGLSADAAVSRRNLAVVERTSRHVRLGPGLSAALRMLSASPLPDRRVVLVSDLARHGFSDVDLPPIEGPAPRLTLLPPIPRDDRTNRSVAGLAAEGLPDGRLAVSARVASWGGPQSDVPLEVRLGGLGEEPRLAGRAEVSPKGGASAERRFELAPPAAGHVVAVAALEADFLPEDDVRTTVHHVARRPRVLVVDGDPQNVSLGSETFYLEKALARDVGLDFDAEIVTLAGLRPEDLRDRDAVILANAPELTEERARALEAAVTSGVGLVVAVGNRVDQRAYNGRLAQLLPATLALPRALESPLAIAGEPPLPPLPRVGVRVHLGLVPDEGAAVLARLEGGAPLLVEGRVGEGRVILVGTTLDRDWTDLPISPHFLAFLRSLIDRVASRREGKVIESVHVGSPVELADLGADAASALTVVGPDGRRAAAGGDGVFRDTELPGAYAVHEGEAVVAAFAVVPDPVESDLSRAPDEVAGLVAPALVLTGAAAGESAGGAGGGGYPAWKTLLVALVVLAMAEAWLARRAA